VDKEENTKEINVDYKDMAARALADLDNFKKRNEEEKQEFRRMATFNVISEFLDVYNNLKQAESFIPADQKDLGWVKGVTMITLQFKERFKLFGIEEFDTLGKIFDHNTMEAVFTDKDETKEDNIVLREISSGFKLGDKVVQHAKVIVNKI
jgi:molecular chaperone GrpE